MPAVTVENILVLPRIPEPDVTGAERKVTSVTTAPSGQRAPRGTRTAGSRPSLHIEAPPEALVMSGGLFHGVQLWVNLPSRLKMTPPRYQDIRACQVALLSSADGGALLRVIAGSFAGFSGPGSTHTPISLVHATVSAGAQVRLPWRADFNALAHVLSGQGSVGLDRRPARMGSWRCSGPARR